MYQPKVILAILVFVALGAQASAQPKVRHPRSLQDAWNDLKKNNRVSMDVELPKVYAEQLKKVQALQHEGCTAKQMAMLNSAILKNHNEMRASLIELGKKIDEVRKMK